jgi:aminoglycoside phosphotransferase (APT) family kinase protein
MPDFIDRPRTVRAGEELDLTRLGPFLLRHFGESAGPVLIEQFPSGHSNLTYLVSIGQRELVLRRPPFGSRVKTAHDMGREYRVLSKLHSFYRLAPKVICCCEDESVLGAPFYIMEPIRGVILRRDPPPGLPFSAETARRLSESFLDNLVALHALDYQAVGLGGLGKPQGYLERQVHGWIERYDGARTNDAPPVERLGEWMKEHMPAASSSALIHNDYKYDNLVLGPAELTRIIGVLDWEMATIGDPLADLATALAYWVDPQDSEDLQAIRWCPSTYPGSLSRAQLIERYSRASGRNVSDMAFYLTFARFKVAVIVQQIYYRYREGLTNDPRFAALGQTVEILLRAALHSAGTSAI